MKLCILYVYPSSKSSQTHINFMLFNIYKIKYIKAKFPTKTSLIQ